MRASYYLMLIATCVLAHSAFGAVRHVPQQYPTIQTAIDAAENGDTVLVDHGTYYENIRFRGKAIIVASRYLVDANVVHIDSTIINGSQPTDPDSGSTVFFVSDEDTNSVLCGMTITGGTGVLIAGIDQRHGGGIYVSSSSGATIRHNRIVSNSVSHNNIAVGGGVLAGSPYVGGGWLVLENNIVLRNTLSANNAVDGGGVCCTMNARIVTNRIERNLGFTGGVGDDGAGLSCFTFVQGGKQLLVSGNIVTGNEFTSTGMDQYGQSGLGGGIAIVGFRGIVENNIITYNQLEGPEVLLGGGLMLSHCSTPLECRGNWICHNTLVGGKVQRGGGVFIYQCNPLLYNNIVVENEGKDGGGIYVGDPSSPSHAILVNNTICSNIGVLASGIYSHASYPVVINSIVWNDGPEICQEGGVISVAYSDVKGGWPGLENINVSPAFVDTLYRLSDSSGCIGAAIDSVQIAGTWYRAPSSCFFGAQRPNPPGSQPDIGACENPRPEPLVDVMDLDGMIPAQHALGQNYPNPFNPSTTIKYELPKASMVRLSVFDLLGREVSVLVNERRDAGVHQVKLDGSGLSSGVYLYRLQAGTFVQTRKLLLLQ